MKNITTSELDEHVEDENINYDFVVSSIVLEYCRKLLGTENVTVFVKSMLQDDKPVVSIVVKRKSTNAMQVANISFSTLESIYNEKDNAHYDLQISKLIGRFKGVENTEEDFLKDKYAPFELTYKP